MRAIRPNIWVQVCVLSNSEYATQTLPAAIMNPMLDELIDLMTRKDERLMKILMTTLLISAFALSACGQTKSIDAPDTAQTRVIKIYFWNIKQDPDLLDCTRVFPLERTVAVGDNIYETALQELFKGVTAEEKERGFETWSAETTKGILEGVKVEDGTAYVDFKDVVYRQMGNATTSCGSGYFSAVESTLKQFPEVKKVFYSIEGRSGDFYDWIQMDCPEDLEGCSIEGS